jgi:hypothetical protein
VFNVGNGWDVIYDFKVAGEQDKIDRRRSTMLTSTTSISA